MATLTCCNVERKAKRTWLFSNRKQFEYEILFEADCPNCKRPIMGHCYFISSAKGTTPMTKIGRKFHESWFLRKQIDTFDMGSKDYRLLIFVGEATLKMARDIATKPIREHRRHYTALALASN